MADISSY